jgi:hypothetical protein
MQMYNIQKQLIDTSKEAGLEINVEETKYMFLSRHQNALQSHDIKTGNRLFENVTLFKDFVTTVINQTLI